MSQLVTAVTASHSCHSCRISIPHIGRPGPSWHLSQPSAAS